MPTYYPPVGFHFKLEVPDLPANDFDVRFTEIGGLSSELATEEVAEGGENRFVQKYPTRTKYPELVLKRGLMNSSEMFKWVQECIHDHQITPRTVIVKLLDEDHEPLMTWSLAGAYPTRWSVSDLNASNNGFVIESMQLFYQSFAVDKKA